MAASSSASASAGDAPPPKYGVPANSYHFADNYNEAIAKGRGNTSHYLAVGSINIGGRRKSSWKNTAIMEDLKTLRCAIVTFAEYDSAVSLEGQPGWHSEPLRVVNGALATWQRDGNLESSLGFCYATDVVSNHTVHECYMFCHNPDAADKNKIYSPVAVIEFTLHAPRCNSYSLTVLLTHFHHKMAKVSSKAITFARRLISMSLQYRVDQWHGDYNMFAYSMVPTVTAIFNEQRAANKDLVSHISPITDTWNDSLWIRFVSKMEKDCIVIAGIAGSPFYSARWKPVAPHQQAMQVLFDSNDCTSHAHAFTTLHGKPVRSAEGQDNQRACKRARKQA